MRCSSLTVSASITAALIAMTVPIADPVSAQTALPFDELEGAPGGHVFVPYSPDPAGLGLVLDGSLDDWADLPAVTTTEGPLPSPDPAQTGSLTWSVAAQGSTLYVFATVPDTTLVAGQHGTDYWNEDSIEFYVNASGELDTPSYAPAITQINFSPVDLGNDDPTELTLTGVNAGRADVEGFVFATDDGWGVEATIGLPDTVTAEHGLNLGFQVHANGSTGGDRDTKLIWSVADATDRSYENPSVFGTAVLWDVSITDAPEVAPREVAEPTADVRTGINVNQVGYLPDGPKVALFARDGRTPLPWSLLDPDGVIVASGDTEFVGTDNWATDQVHRVDFSDVAATGDDFRLRVGGERSHPFSIRDDVYAELADDAFKFFYRSRSGIELLPEFAGDDFARAAGHLSDDGVTCFVGTDQLGDTWDGCDYELDAAGGWYDAGDYGKYVVPAAISTWTLLNAYESAPDAFDDQAGLPESGNGTPDLLDEARWEIEWMLAMEVPAGEPQAGMVHHKLHDHEWEPLPLMPATESEVARSLMPPSTQATLGAAAIGAQCARVWRGLDDEFADRCLAAAERMWVAALADPDEFTGHVPGAGGGPYDDLEPDDEFAWAATELYLTTGDESYRAAAAERISYLDVPSASAPMWWGEVQALAPLSVVANPDAADAEMLERARAEVVDGADWVLAAMRRDGNAYRVPLLRLDWGSNSAVLNNALMLGTAHALTGDNEYRDAMIEATDYVLGRNALNRSFVTGYGAVTPEHVHHRFWANTDDFPAPPPGVVAGGVNAEPADPAALELVGDLPLAFRYIDDVASYSTNEVAINWNAPLFWVTSRLDHLANGFVDGGESAAGDADDA
ncbi:MAG: glycoside hydrolase family 9 protein, partial [Actinomycetota bacterium]